MKTLFDNLESIRHDWEDGYCTDSQAKAAMKQLIEDWNDEQDKNRE